MAELKCVFVGDPDVGKSTLITRYRDQKMEENIPAVVDACTVPVFLDNKTPATTLSLWDSAGHKDYDRVRPLLYPESNLCVICFSVIDRNTYENVQTKWMPELKQHRPNTPILLVGTKTDLRDDDTELRRLSEHNNSPVSQVSGEELARRINAVKYIECSARTQNGVKNVFQEAAKCVIQNRRQSRTHKCCVVL